MIGLYPQTLNLYVFTHIIDIVYVYISIHLGVSQILIKLFSHNLPQTC